MRLLRGRGNTIVLLALIGLAIWQGPALLGWAQLQLFRLGLACPNAGVLLLVGAVAGVVVRSLL